MKSKTSFYTYINYLTRHFSVYVLSSILLVTVVLLCLDIFEDILRIKCVNQVFTVTYSQFSCSDRLIIGKEISKEVSTSIVV